MLICDPTRSSQNHGSRPSRFGGWNRIALFSILSVSVLLLPAAVHGQPGPTIAQSAESLSTHDGVQVEIAAYEPAVVDPVAARFDERGRMWVVEMRDYPTGPSDGKTFDGRIAVLTDENHDGVFEKRVTFVEGLVFPTGLQPWQQGVIVTLAGKIEYMADRDGDGHCDHRETWFEGFEQDNEQLRANHPTLGPDGLVVSANGLRGGMIRAIDGRWSNAKEAVDLRGKDFAFDPRGGFFGVVSGNSQFGLSVDDFGNRVGCSNRNPAFESLFTLDEIGKDRWSVPTDALHDIARPAGESDVRAIAQAWTTSHTHAGQFSAACGVTVGLGDAVPPSWRDDLVVCEPTSYAVQRQRVHREGVGRASTRIDDPAELIASRDTWFRPVDTTLGLDGALYVVDMCRAVIEHPAWAPEELKHRPDERFGNDLGRVWRLAASDAALRSSNEPVPATVAQWVAWLGHTNPTQRQLATAHLMQPDTEATAEEIVATIRAAMRQPGRWSDVGYARALWMLRIHNSLDASDLLAAARDPSPEIRRLAIRLMRSADDTGTSANEFAEVALDLLGDSDEWVRFDTVGLVSELAGEASAWSDQDEFVTKAANRIAARVPSDEVSPLWMRRLAMSSPRLSSALLRELLVRQETPKLPLPSFQRSLVRSLARSLAYADVSAGRDASISVEISVDDEAAIAFTAGWCEGYRVANRQPVSKQNQPDALVWRLFEQSMKSAPIVLADKSLSSDSRLNVLEVLAALGVPHDEILRTLVQDPDDERLQVRALVSLLGMNDARTIQWLGDNILSLSPAVRDAAIIQCAGNEKTAEILLDWIDEKRLPMPLVSIQQSDRLQRSSNPLLASRAKKLFGAARQDRQSVIAEYESSTRGVANMVAGKALFTQHCATCHQIAEQGAAVGPDISDSRVKTPAALLAAILDPNAAIDAGFLAYQALLDDGRLLTGTLIDSDSSQVTLQLAGGERHGIDREELELLQATGVSLMPDGLERSITPDQMRDLLGYLKGWRYLNESVATIDLSQTAR